MLQWFALRVKREGWKLSRKGEKGKEGTYEECPFQLS